MKDVLISIKGIQNYTDPPNAESDVIELVTSGKYSHNSGETVFSYMESEMTGLQGTKTTFRVKPDLVTLSREGTTNSQLVFEKGKKHVFLYETEYGALSMGVSTRQLTSGMNITGGNMRIDYTLDMDSIVVSKNSFIIDIKEVGGTSPAAQ